MILSEATTHPAIGGWVLLSQATTHPAIKSRQGGTQDQTRRWRKGSQERGIHHDWEVGGGNGVGGGGDSSRESRGQCREERVRYKNKGKKTD